MFRQWQGKIVEPDFRRFAWGLSARTVALQRLSQAKFAHRGNERWRSKERMPWPKEYFLEGEPGQGCYTHDAAAEIAHIFLDFLTRAAPSDSYSGLIW